ncbi:MAG TPA: YihY/virulence factor BrkB family protein [Bryobacteraceae bacterium]|jgi:membrane protein|nr:YihY/virulence factor BrkB family protein [Bryobacteraceae bacterium]
MRRVASWLGPTFRYWMQTEVHVYAFSVAANVLLSFYPFLIVLMSLSRVFFDERTTIATIQLALRDYFPDSFTNFLYTKGQHENLPPHRSAELVSIVLLLFTANGIFEPLEVALNRVWGIRRNRSFFRNQLVSLALIFACGTLALVSMALTALNRPWAGRFLALDSLFFKMAALPMAVLVLFLIYYFLPNGRPPLKRVIAAAAGVGILLEVMKYINKLWWPWFQRKLETEYRIFQYSVALIFLGFIAAMLVLAGAEWAARGQSIAERAGKEHAHV